MKKRLLWIGLGILIICQPIFAATPTMTYTSQPAGNVTSFPAAFSISNLAPVPQNLCGATISTSTETATCSGLPVCQGSETQKASFSCSVTTTCNNTISADTAGGQCTVSLNVTKPSTLAASTLFSFSLSYGSYNTVLASNSFTLNGTNPPPPTNSYRTITFTNSCNSTIWFGSITGAAPSQNILTGGSIDCTSAGGNPGQQACVTAGGACYSRVNQADACFSQACSSDSDCMTGSSCYGTTGQCFWNNPTPSNQSFQLTTGNSNTLKIPQYAANGIGVVWSGAFGGRTGCTTGGCTSALCTSGTENAQGVCSLGVGFQQPATQAEPTFITYPTGPSTAEVAPVDAYDVTVINGANVPMSMYLTSGAVTSSANPFNCGAPGYNASVPANGTQANTIGASSWAVTTYQSNLAYRYVVPSSYPAQKKCSTDGDCPGQNCGLSYSSIGSASSPGSGYLVCGDFAGWFTADQVCGTNNNFTTVLNKTGTAVTNFQCNTHISSSQGTMANLYQCNGNYANSCYTTGATNTCCGCVDWGSNSEGTQLAVPTNPSYVTACQAFNDTWTGMFHPNHEPQVYNTILYLKQSCPSCYVYPFDDASSSFTCTNGSTSVDNSVAYTVEFCPGGNGNTGFQP